MKYAVVVSGGKQYLVSEGERFLIDLVANAPDEYIFNDVLLYVEDGKVQIGSPLVSGISVRAKVLGVKKGEKIRVAKFKAKARYRRTMGFRARYKEVEISKINPPQQQK